MLHITPALSAYVLTITALVGLVLGSFLNCLAWRLAHGESALRGRSHCATCNHVLGVGDLIPLLSWLVLKGKCRYCGEKISPRYPAAELLTAVVFVSLVLRYDLAWTAWRFLLLSCVLIAISLVDLETYLIPDRLIVAGIVIFLLFTPLSGVPLWRALLAGLVGGLSVSLPLLGLVLLADKVLGRETMGGGDIKLLFMLGLYFPWTLNLMLLIFACFLGLALAWLMGKTKPGVPFPFGPALGLAAWLVMLMGEPLLGWYLGLFF